MDNDHLYALYLDAYARSRSPNDIRADIMPSNTTAAARLAIAIGVRDAQSRTAIFTFDEFLSVHSETLTPSAASAGRSMVAIVTDELRKLKIEDPSTALLRAALMCEHAKAARDLAHGNLALLNINPSEASDFDAAEGIATRAYRALLSREREVVLSAESSK